MRSYHLTALTVMVALGLRASLPAEERPLSPQPASLPSSSSSSGPPAVRWLTSYSQAASEAKAAGKVILADFTGSDWCIWCKRLHQEVFNTKQFHVWAVDNVVLLELDFPRARNQEPSLKRQNVELATKYAINAFPSVLFLTAEGKLIGATGYMAGGPGPWISRARTILNASQTMPATSRSAN